MFGLALGLDDSVTLATLQTHLQHLNMPQGSLDEVATYLKSVGVSYFDTVVAQTFTNETNVNVILGTPKGNYSVGFQLLQGLWKVSVWSMSDPIDQTVVVSTAKANSYADIYVGQPLSQLIIQSVDAIDGGEDIQVMYATDPPFYLPGSATMDAGQTETIVSEESIDQAQGADDTTIN